MNEKKKILYISNIPTPYRVHFFNGVGNYYDLTVLFERSSAKDRDANWLKSNATSFHSKFMKGIKVRNDKVISFSFFKYIFNKFDLIIIGGYSTPTGILTIFFLKLFNKKFIINADGGFIKQDKSIKEKIKRRLISSAEYWLSTGDMTTKYLVHYGANPLKIYKYSFSSIDNNDFINLSTRIDDKNNNREFLNLDDRKKILFVGQIIHRKGVDLILSIAYNLPDYDFIIVGGSPRKEDTDFINLNKITNVNFINFMDKKMLTRYYRACDLFLLPTREDIWGLVINEAMANGIPVLTTNRCIAGIELLQSEFVISPHRTDSMISMIKNILNDITYQNEIIKSNLSVVQKYTLDQMIEDHKIIFDNILKEL
ncbi:MAG: hypothetical protein A2Y45_00495 [Tenericutes bacterium GWC2_34_14]|nr:MAG: hypothetical protein A2Y45_00495 [Tenericutes bacterium GWC2_34_14]OHE34479.1 MAG: hypothetical protein A2012_08115 [Tenericutes bacterium GWE2_34_108]OHE35835.1 MAG: hypothetical protein A2Y46_02820 [Tenericutes bacterium GWF1_35_14]OHE39078.1 MAG: hypothetical protein A2Y44_07110 [Tenericutes bacterium GWF2_35_184]OHE42855.1 MAG: hypothetical protein A2221_09125 [Tenericutes bacterium RIFOXYA2_FULL_36_32]OHE46083.1 MAG: hypothetical protein A2308_00795 [Tenericutes bacterium RIFOXYB2